LDKPKSMTSCVKGSAIVSSLVLAVVIVVALFLFLALFARGGPTETIRAGTDPETAGLRNLSLAELGSIVARLFGELGFNVVRTEDKPDRVDLTVVDPTPVTGQSFYIRCLAIPEAGAVQSAEVQAALDTAKGENLAKAIVVTPGRFSDEARLVSQSSTLELIDGPALAQLLRKHLPDVANRLGIPR
jgi:hypothetical protein